MPLSHLVLILLHSAPLGRWASLRGWPARVRDSDTVPPRRVQHPLVVADHGAERWPKAQRGSHVQRVEATQLRRVQPGRFVSKRHVELDY
jgi:hypothetical protein